jgi:hypothetical protein
MNWQRRGRTETGRSRTGQIKENKLKDRVKKNVRETGRKKERKWREG